MSDAKSFAIAAHEAVGQKRKYTGEPYWFHPCAVANMLRAKGFDSYIVDAGWLHDVVEDTQIAIDTIDYVFGPYIAALVMEVTDLYTKPEHGNRKTRKRLECERLAKISAKGQSIKLADMIDNTRSIVKHDPDFAKVYMREKAELLEVLTKGHEGLYTEAKKLVDDYYAR